MSDDEVDKSEWVKIESIGPPCCWSACGRNCGEYSWFCRSCGKCGLEWLSAPGNRKTIFMVALALTIIAELLQFWCVLAFVRDDGLAKTTAWTVGTIKLNNVYPPEATNHSNCRVSGELEVYMGPEGMIYDATSFQPNDQCPVDPGAVTTGFIKFEDSSCYQDGSFPQLTAMGYNTTTNFCKECADVSGETEFTAIMALVSQLGQFATDYQRFYRGYDMNCQKFLGVFTGIIGTLSTMVSLSTYSGGCFDKLPTTDSETVKMSWGPGPGFICLVVATLMKLIDAAIHAIVPTPDFRNDEHLVQLVEEWQPEDATKGTVAPQIMKTDSEPTVAFERMDTNTDHTPSPEQDHRLSTATSSPKNLKTSSDC